MCKYFTLLLLIMFPHVPVLAEVYKWTDKSGQIHYGTKPPASNATQAKEIDIKTKGNEKQKSLNSNSKSEQATQKKMEAHAKIMLTMPDGSTVELPANKEEAKHLEMLVRKKATEKSKSMQSKRFLEDFKQVDRRQTKKPINRVLPCSVENNSDCSSRYLEKADYSRLTISGVNFNHSNLEGANFTGSKLRTGTTFQKANLKDAVFTGVSMNNVDFTGADLTGADLRHIQCVGCFFNEANLTGATLSTNHVNRLTFKGANLKDIKITFKQEFAGDFRQVRNFNLVDYYNSLDKDKQRVSAGLQYTVNGCDVGSKYQDCRGKDLSGHKFLNVSLEGADFTGANLVNADLSRATLNNTNFTNANLEGAKLGRFEGVSDFTNAMLTNAVFQNKKIIGKFTNANLSGVNLSKARMDSFVDLSKAILEETNLQGAQLQGANIKGTKFINADIAGAKFNPYLLNHVDVSQCGSCQKHIKNNQVNVSLINKYIEQSQKKIISKKKSRLRKLNTTYSMEIDKLLQGIGVIQDSDLVSILSSMTKDDKPHLHMEAVQIVNSYHHMATLLNRTDTICKNRNIIKAFIPLFSKVSDDYKNNITSKYLDAEGSFEAIQDYAAQCLLVSIEEDEKVQDAFLTAYKESGNFKIKRIYVRGLTEHNKDKSLPLLKEALFNGSLEESKLAAEQLSLWYQPPEELLPDIVEIVMSGDKEKIYFYDLLANYGSRAGRYLGGVEVFEDTLKRKGIQFSDYATLINQLAMRSKLTNFKEPVEVNEQVLFNSLHLTKKNFEAEFNLIPKEKLSLLHPKTNTIPIESITDKIKVWVNDKINQYKSKSIADKLLSNPVYTSDSKVISAIISKYHLNDFSKDAVTAVFTSDYDHVYQGSVGIDGLVFTSGEYAKEAGNMIVSMMPSRHLAIRKDNVLFIVRGDQHTDNRTVHYIYSHFSNVNKMDGEAWRKKHL